MSYLAMRDDWTPEPKPAPIDPKTSSVNAEFERALTRLVETGIAESNARIQDKAQISLPQSAKAEKLPILEFGDDNDTAARFTRDGTLSIWNRADTIELTPAMVETLLSYLREHELKRIEL